MPASENMKCEVAENIRTLPTEIRFILYNQPPSATQHQPMISSVGVPVRSIELPVCCSKR